MSEQYMQKWLISIKQKPLEFIIGSGIFLSAVFGASVNSVASAVLAVWFIISLLFIKNWYSYWQNLQQIEKLVLTAFILYTASGFISYYNVSNEYEYVKHMGRALRFTLIVPVYLLIRNLDKTIFTYFLAGIITSGPAFLIFALISIYQNSALPATGQYHHIIFGDGAILNALIMIGLIFSKKVTGGLRVFVIFSILCALYASVLSTTRGAWVAFPIILGIYFIYYINKNRISVSKIALYLAVFVIILSAVPQLREPITDGTSQAYEEVISFVNDGRHNTSVGGRLALWDVAVDIMKQHPVIGTGPGDFSGDLAEMQKLGRYQSVETFGSAHSIYFQSIAVTGILGFIVLITCLIVLPVVLFYQHIKNTDSFAAMAGLATIVSFALFGLTESWTLRAPLVSIYLAYFVACANGLTVYEGEQK